MIHNLDRRIRPPRLGTIGLGIKVGASDNERPQEVRHFVVPPEIAKVYGAEPTRLPVRFPWNEPEQCLHSIFYEQRKGRTKVRQCDGRLYTEIHSAGQDVQGACPRAKDPDNLYAACAFGCRARARLSVLVPKTRLGIWEIRLGGLGRIADLLAELRLYRAAIGPLSQFPFEIERTEVEEQYFAKDGPRWRNGYPVRLRSPYTLEEVAALHEAQGVQPALSPAPHEEDVVDADEEELNGEVAKPESVAPPSPSTASPGGRSAPAPPVAGTTPVQSPPFLHGSGEAVPDEEIDVSVLFARAAALGIAPVDYTDYLAGVYKADVDNLPLPRAITEQRDFLARDPATVRQTVEKVAENVRSRRGQGQLL